jgi:uncharacterized protein
MIRFSEQNGSLVFTVRVVPRASKSKIVGCLDGALKIRLAAPPVDGAANEELIKTLAKFFEVNKAAVKIASGATGKIKQIRVAGANADKLRAI